MVSIKKEKKGIAENQIISAKRTGRYVCIYCDFMIKLTLE